MPELEMANHLVLTVGGLPTDDHPEGTWYVDAGLGDALHEPTPLVAGPFEQGPFALRLDETHGEDGDWHLTHDRRRRLRRHGLAISTGNDRRLPRQAHVAVHRAGVGLRPRAHRSNSATRRASTSSAAAS
jgi:hypothetical protein